MPEHHHPQSPRSQARGRQRRSELLTAASGLLADRDRTTISLRDLASRAGIPPASAYHFYANADEAFVALAAQMLTELSDDLGAPVADDEVTAWPDVIGIVAQRAAAYFRLRPDARRLLLSSTAPLGLGAQPGEAKATLGTALRDQIAPRLALPAAAGSDEWFENAMEVLMLLFSLSTQRHGTLTDDEVNEAGRAATAYLELHLPRPSDR